MRELEQILGLFVAGVILAAAAGRGGAPYPVFLAVGGALLAFLPGAPTFSVPPELALALFVAPVLLDAAYDASPRDLKDHWAPLAGLVVVAVGLCRWRAPPLHAGGPGDCLGAHLCAARPGDRDRRPPPLEAAESHPDHPR